MRWLGLAPLVLVVACDLRTEPSSRYVAPRFTVSESPALLLAAGDIARCGTSNRAPQTSDVLVARPEALVLAIGDNVYYDGTIAEYQNCYGPTWGRVKDRTKPVPGNHEYHTVNDAGVTVQGPGAPGYFDYFNGVGVDSGVAGKRGKGYYAFDYGAWRIYALNSELSSSGRTSQAAWLAADLAANPRACQLAYFHRPYFTTITGHAPETSRMRSTVDVLIAGKVEIMLSGHNHQYERFRAQTAGGVASPDGIRQYVVGTGGGGIIGTIPTTRANGSEAFGNVHGVLELRLYPDRYETDFIPIAGKSYTDPVSEPCIGAAPPDTLPTDTIIPPPVDTIVPPPVDTIVPPPLPARSIALTVTGRTDATKNYMGLAWTNAVGPSVKVYRNNVLLITTENDGKYTNSRAKQSGPVEYTYRVCDEAVCSNEASVRF